MATNLLISQDIDTGIIVLSMNHEDPDFARELLWASHNILDEYLRERSLKRIERNIEYLTRKLTVLTVADLRQSVVEALSEQEKKRMAASSDLPFVAEPFGEPEQSDRPTRPKPILVLALSIISGLFSGIFFGMLWDRNRVA